MGSQTPSAALRAVAGLAAPFWETKAEAPEIKRERTAVNLAMVEILQQQDGLQI